MAESETVDNGQLKVYSSKFRSYEFLMGELGIENLKKEQLVVGNWY
jgi:hypothetical protein